ncbi:putative secreted Zn-dependent protease [Neorhizobium alkalisoli]|uniref:Putative secreted Zn-dependent protease n=1 Tax=Neorhizobium alkalisoli TaxID=528178 RepID=A0A561QVN8_9HYPH|nr:putative secreted Zn-dependent protease [Neorhizobium alkalisoli]
MRKSLGLIAVMAMLAAGSAEAQQAWKPTEQTKTYPVTGTSGIELYSSIGENGPKAGQHVRAIAHTDFKLTWQRKYEPQADGSCMLTTAKPNLVIIYTLPKLASKLSPDLQAKWVVFIDGVRRHERVHGEMIENLARNIEQVSIGISSPDDPKCTKVRAALQVKIGEIFAAHQQRNRDFDKVELSDGGNVHQLILALVNQR